MLPAYEPKASRTQILDITVNPQRNFLNDKEFLYQKYTVEGSNIGFISQISGLSKTTIKEKIKQYGLEKNKNININIKPLLGQVPYGWRIVKGQLVTHKGEQEVVQKMSTLSKKGKSLRQIAKYLQDSGIKPKNGTKWHATSILKILRRHKSQPT